MSFRIISEESILILDQRREKICRKPDEIIERSDSKKSKSVIGSNGLGTYSSILLDQRAEDRILKKSLVRRQLDQAFFLSCEKFPVYEVIRLARDKEGYAE